MMGYRKQNKLEIAIVTMEYVSKCISDLLKYPVKQEQIIILGYR